MQRTEDMINDAKQRAEEFAELRTAEFLKAFLVDTGILDQEFAEYEGREGTKTEEQFLELLIDDYKAQFGQAMALSYLFGYLDAKEHAPKKMYKKQKVAPQPAPMPAKLILPGVDE